MHGQAQARCLEAPKQRAEVSLLRQSLDAQVAGTEEGVTEPEATFSACFGGAFLMWHPMKYASMLAEKMAQHGTHAWLVNTGWTGGRHALSRVYLEMKTQVALSAHEPQWMPDGRHVDDDEDKVDALLLVLNGEGGRVSNSSVDLGRTGGRHTPRLPAPCPALMWQSCQPALQRVK